MISLLGDTSGLLGTKQFPQLPVSETVSWAGKSVIPCCVDMVNNPYISSAVYSAGSEIVNGVYESYKLGKIVRFDEVMSNSDEDTQLMKLTSDKEKLNTLYEQPLLEKQELSRLFISTTAYNLIATALFGGTVASTLPVAATVVLTSVGVTLTSRLVKKGINLYRKKRLDSTIHKKNMSFNKNKPRKETWFNSEKIHTKNSWKKCYSQHKLSKRLQKS